MSISKHDLIASSVIAWVLDNKFVTENNKPIEFVKHKYLIDYLSDDHPDICSTKASQVGATVAETLDEIHAANFKGWNTIHTLQNSDVIRGFVVPKVNPIIYNNPAIKAIAGKDSENLKQFGQGYVFYRGAQAESQAINISADVLKIDEMDRSDAKVVEMFQSRLDASEISRVRRFSNPSMIGFGVDGLWQKSNQFHWVMRCHHCGYRMYIDWETDDNHCHYVNRDKIIFACGKCHKELSDADRMTGEWVAKYPTRTNRHGYWFTQLMVSWFTAAKIISKYEDNSIDYFYNFTLGKAYTPTDMLVDRQAILRACSPSNIVRSHVAIGVDQDAGGQYYVCMTPEGIFDHGYVDSWDKIEHLKLMYNAIVVCDPNPYSATPKQLANKYSDWYLCYFKNLDSLSAVQWKEKEQVVYADRTRVIDIRANEIVHGKLLYRERPHQLEDVITHWANLYRTTEEKEDGRIRSIWIKKEDRQSDYPFAEVYARIGLSQLLGGGADFVGPTTPSDAPITNVSTEDGKILTVDFKEMLQETWDAQDE